MTELMQKAGSCDGPLNFKKLLPTKKSGEISLTQK
jgi:hypothetical protein